MEILVVGRKLCGKSSFINSLVGKYISIIRSKNDKILEQHKVKLYDKDLIINELKGNYWDNKECRKYIKNSTIVIYIFDINYGFEEDKEYYNKFRLLIETLRSCGNNIKLLLIANKFEDTNDIDLVETINDIKSEYNNVYKYSTYLVGSNTYLDSKSINENKKLKLEVNKINKTLRILDVNKNIDIYKEFIKPVEKAIIEHIETYKEETTLLIEKNRYEIKELVNDDEKEIKEMMLNIMDIYFEKNKNLKPDNEIIKLYSDYNNSKASLQTNTELFKFYYLMKAPANLLYGYIMDKILQQRNDNIKGSYSYYNSSHINLFTIFKKEENTTDCYLGDYLNGNLRCKRYNSSIVDSDKMFSMSTYLKSFNIDIVYVYYWKSHQDFNPDIVTTYRYCVGKTIENNTFGYLKY